MNDYKQELRMWVTKLISGEPDPTEAQLKDWVGTARKLVPQASDEDAAAVIDHFEKNFSIKIETGRRCKSTTSLGTTNSARTWRSTTGRDTGSF